MRVAGVVLAAGEGRRFGGPKALAVLDGERLVDRAVRLLVEGGCAPVVVVSGAAPLDVPSARVVHNPQWRSGMGSSLRVGLASVSGADAAVLVTVDAPWLGAEAVRRVQAAFRQGANAAVATYGGRRGHPVLLAHAHFAEAARLATGDVGARAFLAANPELVTSVPCDGTGIPDDVDTPADLARGEQHHRDHRSPRRDGNGVET
jgi:CTP:molybdopterin cytidylyltransferase MocA